MKLPFLPDEDLSQRVAEGLRRQGIDAVSVHEIGRGSRGLTDAEQLEYAAAEGCMLVTYNRQDFQALDDEWLRQERSHAGILWCADRVGVRATD